MLRRVGFAECAEAWFNLTLGSQERWRVADAVEMFVVFPGDKNENCHFDCANSGRLGLFRVWIKPVFALHSGGLACGLGRPIPEPPVALSRCGISGRRRAPANKPLRAARINVARSGHGQHLAVSPALEPCRRRTGDCRGNSMGIFVLSVSPEFRRLVCTEGGVNRRKEPN